MFTVLSSAWCRIPNVSSAMASSYQSCSRRPSTTSRTSFKYARFSPPTTSASSNTRDFRPPTFPHLSPSARLNSAASSFVPGGQGRIRITDASGHEVNFRRPPASATASPSPPPASLDKSQSRRPPVRIESEDERKKRVAEEEAKSKAKNGRGSESQEGEGRGRAESKEERGRGEGTRAQGGRGSGTS